MWKCCYYRNQAVLVTAARQQSLPVVLHLLLWFLKWAVVFCHKTKSNWNDSDRSPARWMHKNLGKFLCCKVEKNKLGGSRSRKDLLFKISVKLYNIPIENKDKIAFINIMRGIRCNSIPLHEKQIVVAYPAESCWLAFHLWEQNKMELKMQLPKVRMKPSGFTHTFMWVNCFIMQMQTGWL